MSGSNLRRGKKIFFIFFLLQIKQSITVEPEKTVAHFGICFSFFKEGGHILANSEPKKLQVEHFDPLLTNICDVLQLKSNILSCFESVFSGFTVFPAFRNSTI